MDQGLKNKRVLVLVVNDVLGDQRLQKIYSTLTRAGAFVQVYARHLGRPYTKNDFPFNVKRFRLKAKRGMRMYWEMNHIFYKRGIKDSWDLVVSNDLDTLLAGYRISRKVRCRWIFDAHEYFTEVPELKGKWFKRSIWTFLGKWLIPKVDLAITVNDPLAQVLGQKYKKTFSVIRNLAYAKDIKPYMDPFRSRVILYQGVLNKGRGLRQMMDAMEFLENWKLVFIGSGDLENDLKRYKEQLEWSNRIHFEGFVAPSELDDYTRKAFVGLNLLQASSLNYYYSLANKFFDYAQHGIPSINMRFPVYVKYLQSYPCGVAITKLDSNYLAELIENLSKEEFRYRKMQTASFRMIEENNWQIESDKVLRLFKGLLFS